MPGRIRWLSLNSDAFIGLGSLALRFSAMELLLGLLQTQAEFRQPPERNHLSALSRPTACVSLNIGKRNENLAD